MTNCDIAMNSLIKILSSDSKDCQLILIPLGLEKVFNEELQFKKIQPLWSFERFYLVPKACDFLWIQWCAWELKVVDFTSINDAIKILKQKKTIWSNHSFHLHRRNSLIQDGLRKFDHKKRLKFPESKKYFTNGSSLSFWSLLEQNKALIAECTSSPFFLGTMEFDENKTQPPSRAYLKLWEILLKINTYPQKGQKALDLGASPGGWTWVLAELGLDVLSIDKAPLDSKLAKYKNITFLKQSIFGLDPKIYLKFDWVFCDVICYPEKILTLIKQWLDEGFKGNMIFTIKFQGETNFQVINELKSIDNSQLIHLYHNKHELTWIRLQNFS